jgi:hypothetical protein
LFFILERPESWGQQIFWTRWIEIFLFHRRSNKCWSLFSGRYSLWNEMMLMNFIFYDFIFANQVIFLTTRRSNKNFKLSWHNIISPRLAYGCRIEKFWNKKLVDNFTIFIFSKRPNVVIDEIGSCYCLALHSQKYTLRCIGRGNVNIWMWLH